MSIPPRYSSRGKIFTIIKTAMISERIAPAINNIFFIVINFLVSAHNLAKRERELSTPHTGSVCGGGDLSTYFGVFEIG